MGPRRGEDEVTPHTRPPVDIDGEHLLVRTVLCLDGSVEVELICDPVFDYGRVPGEWKLTDDHRHTAEASGAGVTVRLQTSMALGIEGDWIRARHELAQGEQLYCSLSWAEGLRSPQTVDEANEQLAATTRFWRGWLARCPPARSSLARADSAFGAGDQGPDLHADGGDGGGVDDVVARDAGWGAQLGLPVQLDA